MNLLADLKMLRTCFDRQVSELPDMWTAEAPSTGCCHVAALLLHERYGGQIMRCEVEEDAGGWQTTHYFNVIDGVWVDATIDQFTPTPWRVFSYIDATIEPINYTTSTKLGWLRDRFEVAA